MFSCVSLLKHPTVDLLTLEESGMFLQRDTWVSNKCCSATKLQNGHDFQIIAELTSPEQYISGYVMCDGIGTLVRRCASVI